jgi:hypothetical protein
MRVIFRMPAQFIRRADDRILVSCKATLRAAMYVLRQTLGTLRIRSSHLAFWGNGALAGKCGVRCIQRPGRRPSTATAILFIWRSDLQDFGSRESLKMAQQTSAISAGRFNPTRKTSPNELIHCTIMIALPRGGETLRPEDLVTLINNRRRQEGP